MLKGFREFMLRGNVLDLAVAVVIGAAFGAVVTALVKDLITPLIAALVGKPDFSAQTNANWHVVIGQSLNFDTNHPTWRVRQLPQIMHHGNICTLGIACPPAAMAAISVAL